MVNFMNLTMGALRKYKRAYRIRGKATGTKMELVDIISRHFSCLPEPMNEDLCISAFANAIIKNQNDEREMGAVNGKINIYYF